VTGKHWTEDKVIGFRHFRTKHAERYRQDANGQDHHTFFLIAGYSIIQRSQEAEYQQRKYDHCRTILLPVVSTFHGQQGHRENGSGTKH
jgi:hypothetical protein